MIEKGETSQLHEEIESSVGYYRMQSMNQSLLALLVHGTISYAEAMRQSPDPEDLSLKLRRMFPNIEEQGGDMPTTSDFSADRRAPAVQAAVRGAGREDQASAWRRRTSEIAGLHDAIRAARRADRRSSRPRLQELAAGARALRGDYDRLRQEAQEKIDKLMERIKELNQQLMGGGDGTAASEDGDLPVAGR